MYHVRYVCTLRSALYVYAGKTFDVRSCAVYDILCIMARLRNNRIVFVFFFFFFYYFSASVGTFSSRVTFVQR